MAFFKMNFVYFPSDVDFRLSKRALVFRTLIGDEGYDLRVGSEQKFLYKIDGSPVVKCSKTNYSDGYKTNFKIIMKTGNKFHRTSDVLDEANKYYKYLSKNAWKCIGKDKKVSRYEFMRVVNELQVLVKVNEIETFDGVEIFYDGSDVKLVETKYLFSNEYDSIRFGNLHVHPCMLIWDTPPLCVSQSGLLHTHRKGSQPYPTYASDRHIYHDEFVPYSMPTIFYEANRSLVAFWLQMGCQCSALLTTLVARPQLNGNLNLRL
ncbi:uncharacterized protein LOC120353628 [Nilaparvata lugens]|uniref:uncharacterized protein LOC120353628 n=1 Tax=Nilaparvata lugens TaxID=108931 RepID=UPI00193DE7B2|nr:uncharacterized protein LOC120353628 [Nilaparvata lugens]